MIEILKSPYTLGIDLGTTNSSAAIYFKGEAFSLKLDDLENLTIPSCVWFPDKKAEDVKVGRVAKQKILIKPEEVFSSFKSLMKGDDWERDEVNKALIDKFGSIEDLKLSPTDLGAEVLKSIIEAVSNQSDFDVEGEIQEAVICVPANTTDQYSKNVYAAAVLAGLGIKDEEGNVIMDGERPEGIRILEEPTAAALAYGLDMGFLEEDADKEQIILVYDLGGGTFDATVLHIDATGEDSIPRFTVKATRGVAQLGGDDFDQELMKMVSVAFKEDSDIDIFDLKSDQKATTPKALKEAQQKLKEEAERAKIELASGSKDCTIYIPGFLKDGDGGKYDLEHDVKVSEYLPQIAPLLKKANDCVVDVLTDAGITFDEVNRAILVGGSTKAQWVTDSLEELGKKPYMAKNVDVIVSRGAAFYGSSVPVSSASDSGEEEAEMIINKSTNHHLGIELAGGVFSLLVEKDLPKTEPIVKTNTYYNQEQQSTVNISVYKTQSIDVEGEQGEKQPNRKYYVNEKVDGEKVFECIGDVRLMDVPKAPQGTEQVEVTFEIGTDDNLNVSAKIVSTGQEVRSKIEL